MSNVSFSWTTISSRGPLNVTLRRSAESKNVSDYSAASTLYPENGGTMFPINDGTVLQTYKTLHHTTWILQDRFIVGIFIRNCRTNSCFVKRGQSGHFA